ncbi:hypothetical protein SAMN04488541_100275 [Thermoflexibacter ruber]|uniref:Uncharacterized protein n=2 Tax=Thermoflexibacter ruber TaxID=1003 RepID=A0A1I2B277_9BACT|nr:hypothetical protein SAMN04488541_100275 [Thermoflexibacter ruber]
MKIFMDKDAKEKLKQYDPKELLLFVLKYYQIEVLREYGNKIDVEGDFTVEIEGILRYKLLWKNMVVAPFDDLDKLCANISMELNRE